MCYPLNPEKFLVNDGSIHTFKRDISCGIRVLIFLKSQLVTDIKNIVFLFLFRSYRVNFELPA